MEIEVLDLYDAAELLKMNAEVLRRKTTRGPNEKTN
jgi:hypothetical protein